MKKNQFATLVSAVKENLEKIKKKKINLSGKIDFTEFKSSEGKYILDMYKHNLSRLQGLINNAGIPGRVNELLRLLSVNDIDGNMKVIEELEYFEDIEIQPQRATVKISKVPDEIREEVKVDLNELDKCFKHGCYRSSVILCGRIMEVCLHAKYYKVTGFDILEKNPGIGLGKLIAKMAEKNIKIDPGLTQQIHLVNNVRIFSVHKKQRTFIPSRQQTEAIILYTFDVIDKLF